MSRKEDDNKPEVVHDDSLSGDNSSSDIEKNSGKISTPYVKTKAEVKYVRKVGWTFLPFMTTIVMVQVYNNKEKNNNNNNNNNA